MCSPHTCRGHISAGLAAPRAQILAEPHPAAPPHPQGFGLGRGGEAVTPRPWLAGTAQTLAPALPALPGFVGTADCRTGRLSHGSAQFVFIQSILLLNETITANTGPEDKP